MKERFFFIGFIFIVAVSSFADIPKKGTASSRPNIVLILADDMGYECVGANGGTSYKTPVLDQLARTGVRFEHCYSQPLCTPSRVKIMTGIYNVRNYVEFGVLDRNQTTFAHLLKERGYVTCIAGKWQLGREPDSPQHFGFDESCLWQHTRKATDAKKRDTRYLNPNLEINGKPVDYTNGEYGPDVVSDFICDFMKRNRDKPFLVYYPMILTHSPFVPTPDRKDPNGNNPQKNFVDMVAYADKLVGKITAKLDDLGIREKTLILFTGDNGTAGAIKSELNGRQVRGGKAKMTDAGTRVPLIANWPGTITEGVVLNDLVDFSDFLPTLCEAAGVGVPHELDIDGRSFLPQLKGQKGNPREWIYCWFSRKSGTPAVEEWARNRRYKLYRTGEFYDVSKDDLEKSPLMNLSPEAQQVRAMLQKALDQYKDARPAEHSAPSSVNKDGKQSSAKSEPVAGLETGNSRTSNVGSLSGRKPNVILILADDLGYGDCGVYNPQSKIKTPHIDQLAIEGLLFTDAHSAGSTCTPSRYGLLTGINPARTGVLNTLLQKGDPIIAEDETTIASLLKDQGYTTKMIGKWHLGFQMDAKRQYDFSKPLLGGPLDRGFESFYGIPSSPGAKPLFYIRGREAVDLPTEKGMAAPGFVQEEVSPSFCREAIEIIREHAASKETKPLFLYYASPVPHQPWVPTKAFKGKSKLGDYGDFVMQLDDEVGQINNALKETGLDKNTILIFASDNGPSPVAVQEMSGFGHTSAGVLRGKKSDSWEGGHRIPFIMKWPGRIPAASVSDSTINFTDLFATLAELMEVDMAKDYPGALDSLSFLSVLSAPSQTHKRQAMMFHRGAVRDGDWKLVSKQQVREMEAVKLSQFELFHLGEDLSEKNNLSKTYPEQTEHLFEEFRKFAENRELK